ncbi:MAG: amino acid/polyamine/organocation transporter, superfamily [Ilumatobacteraceae bacterium]|nr:amino acid/polyamine/organocation transporter, superfamily [Ilumatobacteraceae bacterium]MCU1387765.1 amino acid/polyamine/organocation transporter, superfamily [Ilumatobacteraceae bacterium]
MTTDEVPTRLARRLGLSDAVFVGLGSMIGAGVFAAVGPAANAAGSGLLIGLAIAAAVAYCNATSSAALAAVYPASGGTYVYGRERLGPFWGFLAGWGFVVGKTASCAAMALTVGAYAAPSWQRPIAVTAVVCLTAVNYLGVRKTAILTRIIVVLVLAALTLVVIGTAFGGAASTDHITGLGSGGPDGILRSAGLLFFAFAGYARIATLGEEVDQPARTIPKAIVRAFAITLVVYTVVSVSALAAVGPDALARSDAPLATAVRAGDLAALVPAVRVGGTIAALGVLLSLIAGVSRTTFAMAADRELPTWLDAVHPIRKVPHHAEVAAGTVIVILVTLVDLREAIGFSSFCVLAYYAIANASAWTLEPEHRRWPRSLAAVGVAGCVLLAFTLPAVVILSGAGVLAAGAIVWTFRHRRR